MIRILFAAFAIIAFTCCQNQSQTHKYFIVKSIKDKDVADGRYYDKVSVDTIEAISDSAAYFQGVFTYIGNLEGSKVVKKQGVEPHTVVKSFEVRNEKQENIKNNLSPKCLQESNAFIVMHGGKPQ